MQNIEEYYNNFNSRLIKDYINDNLRVKNAIISLTKYIPKSTESILDIGCGIGWSSHEFANNFENANVDGIDLSPKLIQTAKKIFQRNNLTFSVRDLTKKLPSKTYKVVALLDVYEHIPISNRCEFHKMLKNILMDEARILISCPSIYHQNWLRQNNPNNLQPVDEDIDLTSILRIAEDLGGEVIYFEYQKIWQAFDYLHAVIQIGSTYGMGSIVNNNSIHLEHGTSKRTRLSTNLNMNFPAKKINTKQKIVSLIRRCFGKNSFCL